MTNTDSNPLDNIIAGELVALAKQIRAWQELMKYSDNELLRKLPGLGSTKTFVRISKGDLAELDLDRWLDDYRTVSAVIESLRGCDSKEEELFSDVSTVVQLRRSLTELLKETSIRRVVLIEGDSGMGKSSALAQLRAQYGQRIIVIEATAVWGDNPNAFLAAILDALGAREQPSSRDARLRMVVAKLRARRVALAIDEAHHLGADCLNTCKTLINETARSANPCEIILLALPTLWRRLERAAFEEVRQLLGNRLAERIRLGDLREADVRKLLSRRCKIDDPKAAGAVLREAKTRGNLSFAAAVCRRLELMEIPEPLTLDDVAQAVALEVARRP